MLTPTDERVIKAINQDEFRGFSFINTDFGKLYQTGYEGYSAHAAKTAPTAATTTVPPPTAAAATGGSGRGLEGGNGDAAERINNSTSTTAAITVAGTSPSSSSPLPTNKSDSVSHNAVGNSATTPTGEPPAAPLAAKCNTDHATASTDLLVTSQITHNDISVTTPAPVGNKDMTQLGAGTNSTTPVVPGGGAAAAPPATMATAVSS